MELFSKGGTSPWVLHISKACDRPTGKQATVRFLVDSGATYTLLPHKDWQAIGLSPKRAASFTLADGTTIERQVSECHIAQSKGERDTPIILGEPGDEPLLGVVTLEILGLVLNHFTRKLQPMRLLLALQMTKNPILVSESQLVLSFSILSG
jgi:clan AA aspartic protease